MYKPVAENDEEKILQILDMYKNIYRIIAVVIMGIGIGLTPFLQHIVKGAEGLSLFDLRLYFLIFLFNTVAGYFVVYKYSYINSCMKNYVTTNIDVVVNFLMITCQLIILFITKSYLAYIITHSVIVLISKIGISIYLNKVFPILKLKPKNKLPKDEKKKIYDEVKGLFIHQFSSVAVHCTDNIIISSARGLGVITVGLINNYNMIINSVVGFVTIIFNSVTSGFGNLVASSDQKNYRDVFLEMNFINFWLYGICAIAFFCLIPPFITLWIGKDYLIDTYSFLLIIINCYFLGQSSIYNNARIAKGNFAKDKWSSLLQAIVNLVVSIILVNKMGLMGVYIGTIASRMVALIIRPYNTYRFLYGKSCLEYYGVLTKYFLVVAFAGVVTHFVVSYITQSVTLFRFIISVCIVAVLPNLVFIIIFGKSREYKQVVKRIKNIIISKKGSNNK